MSACASVDSLYSRRTLLSWMDHWLRSSLHFPFHRKRLVVENLVFVGDREYPKPSSTRLTRLLQANAMFNADWLGHSHLPRFTPMADTLCSAAGSSGMQRGQANKLNVPRILPTVLATRAPLLPSFLFNLRYSHRLSEPRISYFLVLQVQMDRLPVRGRGNRTRTHPQGRGDHGKGLRKAASRHLPGEA